MSYYYQRLSNRWQKLSFFEQMANIGSEVERAINWRGKDNDLFPESDPPAGGPTLVGDEAISINARSAIQSGTQNPDRKVVGFLYSREATERALELLFLTIADLKNASRLKELTRLYEVLVDYFFGQNQYSSSDSLWQKYFYAFNYAARINVR